MFEQFYEEMDKDDKAAELCHKLRGIIMRKKLFCDMDEEAATFLDSELKKVTEMLNRFMEGDDEAKKYILKNYPSEISSYNIKTEEGNYNG